MNPNSSAPTTSPGLIAATNVFAESACWTAASAILLSPAPISTPTIPPSRPSKPDSNKNKSVMSELRAPTAFINPISFVRSTTLVYMVFIIPMPPTRRDMAAIPTMTPCTTPKIVAKLCASCSDVCATKSSLPFSTFLCLRRFSATAAATFSGDSPFLTRAMIIDSSSGLFVRARASSPFM